MTAPAALQIAPLQPEDIRTLYLPWSSPFDSRTLADHVRAHPRRAFWLPQTGEYVVGEPWRHRDEITAVADIAARDHGDVLIERLRRPNPAVGHELVVMTDFVGARQPGAYARLGLGLMQEVICYELRVVPPDPPRGTLAFARISVDRTDDLASLLTVDHAAFPWLWWNSVAEFAAYARVPGVELYVGRDARDVPVAYVGITHFRGWGHLDRIGVVPGVQGTGYGLEALRFAVHLLRNGGATRVGLSTQANNTRSQHLYHRYGFQRTYQNDYNIYGAWVNPNRAPRALAPDRPEETER
jgi:ribosomal protein S18 acetylase RimI-like enzyme